MSWLKNVAQWFSPRERYIAQQRALGKTPEEIDIQLRLHNARQWIATRRREIYERDNPPPQLRIVDAIRGPFDDDITHTELNIFEHRREMEEYEAGYQEVLSQEHAKLQQELEEEEAALHVVHQRTET